ncbi:MAG: histidinol-phosphatase HisJ family protein, partial [Bacteroidales bacterium]|nr:histidinol-phosphatase HisJ family protein [Bacteroidales bacterium]
MKTNFHTHSRYCDGRGELRDYVEYAIAHGFSQLGFSGHAPMPMDDGACMSMENFKRYVQDARALQREYEDRIQLFLGLEIDYIPGLQEDFRPLIEMGGLDYCIGSVHHVNDPRDPMNLWMIDGSKQEVYDEGLERVFGGDMKRGLTAFFHQNN